MLVNEYTGGRLPIYHFDTYRLKDDDEFLNLGPDEYFDGAGITFVEWADRVADCCRPTPGNHDRSTRRKRRCRDLRPRHDARMELVIKSRKRLE